MNKKIKGLLIIGFLALFFTSCNAQVCDSLPNKFDSYQVALKLINSSKFNLSEECNTSKSSWIKNAEFYSCDLNVGFLLIKTSKKTYIHSNVPLKIWSEFKKADSYGSFYASKIKGKYQLKLN
ncbi:MAG: KTSC domain-containing protein [Candidatus Marinimicrobia bacterium]|nr:KTSC domain-containing protein [Candidatus Neomarinimicrobiota bacterium]